MLAQTPRLAVEPTVVAASMEVPTEGPTTAATPPQPLGRRSLPLPRAGPQRLGRIACDRDGLRERRCGGNRSCNRLGSNERVNTRRVPGVESAYCLHDLSYAAQRRVA